MRAVVITFLFVFTTLLSKAQIKLEPISEQVVESQRLHVLKALKYIGNNTALMVSKGTCYKVDLTTGKETPIATGFKPRVDYFPMSADGKYFLERNFELKNIVKSDGKKLILVADIDAELGKAGYPALPYVSTMSSFLNAGNHLYSIGFWTQDSAYLREAKGFYNYPAFALFNSKTGKLSFEGKQRPKSNRTAYYAGTFTLNDASKQRILTVSVDNATISAYNHEGKLIGQSSVPDSIKSKFRTIDQIPPSKYKDWGFYEVSKTLLRYKSDQYYGVKGIVRLNDRYIGLKIGKADKDIYFVFDNDLQFKGYFEEPSELSDLVYADGDKTIFINKYDKKVRTVRVR